MNYINVDNREIKLLEDDDFSFMRAGEGQVIVRFATELSLRDIKAIFEKNKYIEHYKNDVLVEELENFNVIESLRLETDRNINGVIVPYMAEIVLNKAEVKYVTQEDYDVLADAIVELAEIIGG